MRLWHGLALWLLLTALLRLTVGDAEVWTAPEVDALEAGVNLAEKLTDDEGADGAGLLERLRAGFQVPPDQPRAALLPAEPPWRRAVAEAPVPKWLAAAAVMLAPTSTSSTNGTRAATGAAAALALAAVMLLAGLWRRDRVVAVLAAGILLLQPGALVAAGAGGYGAAAALAMALLVWTAGRLCAPTRAGGGLLVGGALGLALGVHPAAAYLIIPVFVAYAVARRAPARKPDALPGEVGLPPAPLSLFAAPLVAVLVLVALWPPLWEGTARRLGAWLMDNGWIFNPPYDIAGVVYDQAHGRAAMAWTPLVQWAGWHAVPLTVAFVAGVGRAIARGREADWFPLLAWVALMLVAAADGGLFGGRLSILPLLWVPAAIVCAEGVRELAGGLARRLATPPALATPLVTAALLLPMVLTTALGVPPAPWAQTGASLLAPVPVDLLRQIARTAPGARVHLAPNPEQLRPGLAVARDHFELPLRWSTATKADWVITVGVPAPVTAARPTRWVGEVMGLPLVVDGPAGGPTLGTAGSGPGGGADRLTRASAAGVDNAGDPPQAKSVQDVSFSVSCARRHSSTGRGTRCTSGRVQARAH